MQKRRTGGNESARAAAGRALLVAGVGYRIGQTFTASCTGALTGIELGVSRGNDFTYPDVVLRVSGPSGVLGTASLPSAPLLVGELPELSHDFDCNLYWYVDDTGGDPYPGGGETLNGDPRGDLDLAFKTFVLGCPAS